MTWVAYVTLFAAGLGVGLSVGVVLMATMRAGARYDRETENMLDNAECSSLVVHDFTGNRRPRVF